jgi:hypothetical protein
LNLAKPTSPPAQKSLSLLRLLPPIGADQLGLQT